MYINMKEILSSVRKDNFNKIRLSTATIIIRILSQLVTHTNEVMIFHLQ